jgi:diguanylate cyclase (GGDEF)-like protein
VSATIVRKVGSVEARLAALHHISLQMMASDSVDELLQSTVEDACRLVDSNLGILAEVNQKTGRLSRVYPTARIRDIAPDGVVMKGQGLLGRILAGEEIRVAEARNAEGFVGFPDWHPTLGPLLGLPVAHEGKTLAILLVGRDPGQPPFGDADTELVETIAQMAAMVLRDRLRTREFEALTRQLAEMAATDQLTGIANRRSFDDAVARAHAEALRHGNGYGLLVIDVDRFKSFNDTHGHPAGDQALKQVAAVLADTIRVEDQVFRYGGEEFAVIARVHGDRGLTSLGERLRVAVEELEIEHGGEGHEILTCSLGGAAFSRRSAAVQAAKWETVLDRADIALYRAKNEGRNKVVVWRP